MSYAVRLTGRSARERARRLVDAAPDYAVVQIRAADRTNDQNSKLWAMLTDVALARPEGRAWPPEIWKSAFMAALGWEVKWQPGIEGGPPFPTDYRTSKLSKAQFSELIESIYAYGARHGVKWSEGVAA